MNSEEHQNVVKFVLFNISYEVRYFWQTFKMATEEFFAQYKCYICKSFYSTRNIGSNRPMQCVDCFTFNLPIAEVSYSPFKCEF